MKSVLLTYQIHSSSLSPRGIETDSDSIACAQLDSHTLTAMHSPVHVKGSDLSLLLVNGSDFLSQLLQRIKLDTTLSYLTVCFWIYVVRSEPGPIRRKPVIHGNSLRFVLMCNEWIRFNLKWWGTSDDMNSCHLLNWTEQLASFFVFPLSDFGRSRS